jgi:hypothetical protein
MLGLVVSALVHLASFFGVAFGGAWVLHVGAMALAMPVVLTAGIARAPWWPPSARTRAMLRDAPPWGERVLQLVFLNFLVHFGALLVLTRGTVPGEGAWLRAHEGRMFSAGWMIVYLLCALAWWPLGPSYREDGRSRPAP